MREITEIVKIATTLNSDRYENGIRTIVPHHKLEAIAEICRQRNYIEGDIAQVGVWRGGAAIVLAECRENDLKTIHLFDTFTGIPFVSEEDNIHRVGDFGSGDAGHHVSVKDVRDTLAIYPNILIYQGVFPKDTAHNVNLKKFSLVHLDVDVYQSYKEAYEFFLPRMASGGVILVDDYGISSCLGCTQATDEFLAKNNLTKVDYKGQIYIPIP